MVLEVRTLPALVAVLAGETVEVFPPALPILGQVGESLQDLDVVCHIVGLILYRYLSISLRWNYYDDYHP